MFITVIFVSLYPCFLVHVEVYVCTHSLSA
jgi:hypothetical protein